MKYKSVHLVGIGGIGLSAIARVLVSRGLQVSGSDIANTPITDGLSEEGVRVFLGHRQENVGPDVDLVVVTSAASGLNPEVEAARARGIRVVKRREFLGELTEGYRTIAVAGTHGKTTTTALVGLILADAGLDPVVLVGGMVREFGGNTRTGKREFFVIEADEYDYAFLSLEPYVGIVTNVDYDHPDLFPTREEYLAAFGEFAAHVRQDGALIVCGDDEGALAAAARRRASPVTYGFGESNDWRAEDTRSNGSGGSDFRVMNNGKVVAELSTRIPGRHNVTNALAAFATADFLGVSTKSAGLTLERFGGVERRFQVRGMWDGVTIVDDYAHHPAEIRATLAAARERYGGSELWAVFQPHTFSRTRALLSEFASALESADHVIVTEIYAARERDTLGMSGRDIVAGMKHPDARFLATLQEALAVVRENAKPGSVVITIGAGDVTRLAQCLVEKRDGDRPAS